MQIMAIIIVRIRSMDDEIYIYIYFLSFDNLLTIFIDGD